LIIVFTNFEFIHWIYLLKKFQQNIKQLHWGRTQPIYGRQCKPAGWTWPDCCEMEEVFCCTARAVNWHRQCASQERRRGIFKVKNLVLRKMAHSVKNDVFHQILANFTKYSIKLF
jgi:hypothetical protein